MIRKILVGPAVGDAAGSLRFAARLATSSGAELVVVELAPLVDARAVFDPAGVPRQADQLQQLQDDFPELQLRSSGARGGPQRALCDAAEDEQPDLIVAAPRPGGRPGARLSRRTLRALRERAPCAVLLVAA